MNTVDTLIRDGLPASILARTALSPLDPTARLREVWIAIRTDAAPFDPLHPLIEGDGTISNRWDGSTAARLGYILAVLIGSGAVDVLVHFGPGLFRTGGSSGTPSIYSKWRPFHALEFHSTPGQPYSIEATTNFFDWQSLITNTTDANGLIQFDDTNAPSIPYRFYRGNATP
jgi:hypothetical protein